MQFPEITRWTNAFSAFIHALGIGLFISILGIIGVILMTSFGNERKGMLAKAAAWCAVFGFAFIVGGPVLQTIAQRIFG
ncbi:hypothetical protein [Dictyobacter formicarum]|uniref:TrbC/VIRB2 family protein n=1 Tax=Dictyobacter formicarum TaxID=2778368 RepID=A0ABQ3VT00_9CHLR|nr:hypothetical protein [Dictyobacter formicarum]GHO89414.1 hypothetical protein KSZ_74200 [Dictyobacter formicarum]